jgi:protein ImuA
MMLPLAKSEIVTGLQTDILRLQGFHSFKTKSLDVGLGPIEEAFPNATFPVGAVHEFLTATKEEQAASGGFISGLLAALMRHHGAIAWISAARTLFPPALKNFGVEPDRFIFIDLQKEKEVIRAMEEALKCGALTAVVAELKDLSFIDSRRLQLAVEQSQVTGFIIRTNYKSPNTTACISRWRITPLRSEAFDDLPGVGFPKWNVELIRMRNGKPGAWSLQCINGRFTVSASELIERHQQKKAG